MKENKKSIYADGFMSAAGFTVRRGAPIQFPVYTGGAIVTPTLTPSGGGTSGTFIRPVLTGGTGALVPPVVTPSGGAGTTFGGLTLPPIRYGGVITPHISPTLFTGATVVTNPDGSTTILPNTGGIVVTPPNPITPSTGGGSGGGSDSGAGAGDSGAAPAADSQSASPSQVTTSETSVIEGANVGFEEDGDSSFIDEDDYGINIGDQDLFTPESVSVKEDGQVTLSDVGGDAYLPKGKYEADNTLLYSVAAVIGVCLLVAGFKIAYKKKK